MKPQAFKAKVGAVEKGGMALIELPFDVKATFGKARAPVKVTLNGTTTWRTTVSVYGGTSYIGARREIREQTKGFEAGKTITVLVELDDAPRVVTPPADLKKALEGEKAAAWKKLSFTHQNEWVKALEDAKKPETRARRLKQLLESLT